MAASTKPLNTAAGEKSMDCDLSEIELTELAARLHPDDYIMLGARLGFIKARLDQFKHDNPGSIATAMAAMLIRWRNNQTGPHSVMRKKLYEELNTIGRADLAESVYNAESASSVSAPVHPCYHHKSEDSTHFCESCKQPSCGDCVADKHNGHRLFSLNKHKNNLRQKLTDTVKDVNEITTRIARLKLTSRLQPNVSLAGNLKGDIYKAAANSVQALAEDQAKLLRHVEAIEASCNGNIWDDISHRLNNCSSIAQKENAAKEYYDDVTEIEEAIQTVQVVKQASAEGGILTYLYNPKVEFIPNPAICLGRLEETTGWYLQKRIDLPEDKAEYMNACTALSGRREVAVGYHNGGIDIIGIDDGRKRRVLDDKNVYGTVHMGGGNIVLIDTYWEMGFHAIDEQQIKSTASHVTRKTSKYCCLSIDTNNKIYIGYSEFKEIDVFNQSGGPPIKTIKTGLEPWFISVMKTGHIAVTENMWGIKDAVQVITQDGEVVCSIPGGDGLVPFSTCDQQDNIYVALRDKDGKTSIRKYSADGKCLETITDELCCSPVPWVQLSCLSPSELVVCDHLSLHIFCRRPTLSELLELMK